MLPYLCTAYTHQVSSFCPDLPRNAKEYYFNFWTTCEFSKFASFKVNDSSESSLLGKVVIKAKSLEVCCGD